ncbi:hypothetical protein BA724_07390 [Domibacillus iocasae]|uniref:Uncharacterized protein n=1 Tax=Domibacillus iocasae TaxID=1714016 RepID=A0A1E7DM07_9BACI|nr:hypothetical protein BA724_07390 [Domibacillus iocasae]
MHHPFKRIISFLHFIRNHFFHMIRENNGKKIMWLHHTHSSSRSSAVFSLPKTAKKSRPFSFIVFRLELF